MPSRLHGLVLQEACVIHLLLLKAVEERCFIETRLLLAFFGMQLKVFRVRVGQGQRDVESRRLFAPRGTEL